ncbi:MAG: DUF3784 domain-containing protein [Lachnospiraceae bacterium]|nr:DUF3784 domain-containing protein [Lachnospiraceae bacterium]
MFAYSVILFAAALILLVLGIMLDRGRTDLIIDYHQTRVRESDKKEYGRAFGKAMFCIFLTMTASGVIALFGESKTVVLSSAAVLFVGLIASIVWIVKIQKKYNGSIF